MGDLVANLSQWVVDALYFFGYPGVSVLVALGYLHLPVPTVLVLPLSGFLVGQGLFSFVPVLVASTVGGGVASLIMYFPGLWVGEENLRHTAARQQRPPQIRPGTSRACFHSPYPRHLLPRPQGDGRWDRRRDGRSPRITLDVLRWCSSWCRRAPVQRRGSLVSRRLRDFSE